MRKEDLRIVFMGTPEFAVGTLKALVEGGYNVVAVVTQPDKPVGRHGSVLRSPEVKVYAQEHDIPVLQPVKMKDEEFLAELRSYKADLQVVVAFRMLPEVVWAMPKYGTFNVHAALLPQYRGAAPINWAIINGETRTGVTTFFLDHDIDTGRVIMQRSFEIPLEADVEYVYDGLMELGAQTAVETIERIIEGEGSVETLPQEEMIEVGTELHPAPKIFKDTCKIDWTQPVKRVYDFIRGLCPIPGSWGEVVLPDGTQMELKVYQSALTERPTNDIVAGTLIKEKKAVFVACSDCLLELKTVQPNGKKRMDAISFANGLH
ncbi:MAG: methionyl-tRNA formyltransferase [Prevotella sp.]|nr:methionyl-tRNA formyltransferase [Candidatus Prevotella equi]